VVGGRAEIQPVLAADNADGEISFQHAAADQTGKRLIDAKRNHITQCEPNVPTEFPLDITAEPAATTQTYSVDGLTNGVTYFLALRAIDEGDLVGPLSAVVSGAPQATCGAAQCADDPGCSCSQQAATPSARLGLGLMLLALVLLIAPKRRRP
jgi:MYXO-CTERM domain-containing protein